MGFAKEDAVKLQDTDLLSSHAHAQVEYLHLQVQVRTTWQNYKQDDDQVILKH